MATILRAPVISSYAQRKTQPPDLIPNLLLSTLALISSSPPITPAQSANPKPKLVSAQTDLVSMPLLLRQQPAQQMPIGQNGYDEWCQPRLRPPQTQDTNVPRSLVTALAPTPLPFVSDLDLAQSRTSPRQTQDTNVQRSLVTLLAPLPLPFVPAAGFAQPRLKPAQAQDVHVPNVLLRNLLPAQQLPVGANGYDETAQPRNIVGGQADVPPNLLVSTLAPASSPPYMLRTPILSGQIARRTTQDTNTANTLVRLPVVAAVLPPGANGHDFTQPPTRPGAQDTNVANLLTAVLQLGPGPFIPTETWQIGPVSRPQDTDAPNALLRLLPPSGLPQLPPGTLGYDEWNQPRVVGRSQDTTTPNLLVRISTPAQLLPLGTNGYDESAQVRAPSRAQDTGISNALILALPPAQLLPLGTNGYDESSQPKPRAGYQTDLAPNLLTSTLAPVGTLPNIGPPADWTVVRLRTAAQDTGLYANLLTSTLNLIPGPFIPAATWQIGALTRAQDTQVPSRLLQLLPPGAPPPPVTPIDTTQRARPIPPQVDIWPNPLLRNLLPAQQLPVGQNGYDEWCQPRLIYRPQDTGVPNLLIRITIPGQIPAPFAPLDTTQVSRSAKWQTELPPNALLSGLPPAQQLAVGANGVDFTQTGRKTGAQTEAVPNLLTNTLALRLAPIVPVPFEQISRAKPAQTEVLSVNLLLRALLPPPLITPVDFTPSLPGKVARQYEQFTNLTLLQLPPTVHELPGAVRIVITYDHTRITLTEDSTRILLDDDGHVITLQ